MEEDWKREVLSDEILPYGSVVACTEVRQRAIRLIGKDDLSESRHEEWKKEAAKYHRDDRQSDCRRSVSFDFFFEAQFSLYAPSESNAMSMSLIPMKGTMIPPAPQMSAFLMNRAIVLVGLNRIPPIARGIRSGMMIALKMSAERTAVFSPSPRTFRAFSSGRVVANITGTIAKYLATSLAMLNVVTAPRVMSSCFPSITTSMIFAGFDSKSTMLAASFAA